MFTLLTNAHLYSPKDLGIQHLLVAGSTIVWIGDHEPRLGDLEGSLDRIDLEQRRVIPGLIDPHVHLTGGGGEAGAATRVPPILLDRLTACGVTSAVGVLGTDDLTRTPAGLLARTRGLCDQGFNAWCLTGGYHLPSVTVTGSVRSDIVHIDRMIGVGEVAISDHRSSQPTLQQILEVAAEAHVAELMTNKAGVLHLHVGDGERGLELVRQSLDQSELPARTFHPTHVNRRRALFGEALELADRGCTIDITTFPPLSDTQSATDPDAEINADQALIEFLDANLDPTRVTMSSDGGGCLPSFDQEQRVAGFEIAEPSSIARCLARLLQSDHALERVLPAFTSNTAKTLRLHNKGSLVVGGDADLVVLDQPGAPNLARDVMLGGVWQRRNQQQLVRDVFAQQS